MLGIVFGTVLASGIVFALSHDTVVALLVAAVYLLIEIADNTQNIRKRLEHSQKD